MAADSQLSAGDYIKPESMKKVHRLPNGSLFAAAGDTGSWLSLLGWFRGSAGDRPSISDDAEAIVVSRAGVVEYFTGAGKRIVNAPFVALGSGLPVLLGALHAGASAEEAIRIAILVDPYSGGEVQIERLSDG